MNAKEFAKKLEDNIKKASRKNKDTGKLEKSIKVEPLLTQDGFEFKITMLEYGVYQKVDFIDQALNETFTENNITDLVDEIIDEIIN